MRTIPHYVNGKAVDPGPRRGRLDVTDPSTGSVVATVALADVELVDVAVGAAAAALPAWRDTPVLHRQRTLVAYRGRLDQHRRDVAALVSREHGKTVDDALGEVGRGIEVVDHLCGLLLDHVRPGMEVYREEVFGPVLAVVRVPHLPAALDLVNANPYGNGAALFTESGRVAHWFQQRVTAGMVGVNVPIPVPVSFHSFGGWKDSLFGDTHVYGAEGLRFYTRPQVTTSRWGDPAAAPDPTDLAFPSPTNNPY